MPTSAETYYRDQQILAILAMRQARRAWGQINTNDINGSWDEITQRLALEMGIFQVRAATDAIGYIDTAIQEQGGAPPEVKVDPIAFSGSTSDGRDMTGLLDQPRIRTLTDLKGGANLADALSAGRNALDRIAVTQIQDAGRVAAGVEIAVRSDVAGYIRMLNPPSCSRCIMLAGHFYRWNAGFRRHPSCRCFHRPVLKADDGYRPSPEQPGYLDNPVTGKYLDNPKFTDPEAVFKSLSTAEQDRTFTKAGAQAIRDGASMNAVVNARHAGSTIGGHGMYTAAGGWKATDVGTGPKSLAGQRLRNGKRMRVTRLMPESLYLQAAGDRIEVLRLLRLHGYII